MSKKIKGFGYSQATRPGRRPTSPTFAPGKGKSRNQHSSAGAASPADAAPDGAGIYNDAGGRKEVAPTALNAAGPKRNAGAEKFRQFLPAVFNPDYELEPGARPPRAQFFAPPRKTRTHGKIPSVRGRVTRNQLAARRAQQRPGRACSPTSVFGINATFGLLAFSVRPSVFK